MSNNLIIDLKRRVDKYGKFYHIGRLKAPISLNCSDGVVFLIYTSEENAEQLQIAAMDSRQKDMED